MTSQVQVAAPAKTFFGITIGSDAIKRVSMYIFEISENELLVTPSSLN